MSIRDKAGLPPVLEPEPPKPTPAPAPIPSSIPVVPGSHSAALQALSAAKQALLGSVVAIEAAERLLQSPPPRSAPEPVRMPTPRERPPSPERCEHLYTQRLDAMGTTVFLCTDCGEQVDP